MAVGQTYTPKAIRIDAPPGTDTAEPLRIAALQPGTLTKDQIEAGLQRIVDTGLFSDVSYTVSSAALVIKLTPAVSSQALPVRYANFVWWQPGELEPLVEARLPIFHGSLPLAGTLTDQVEAVLVDLLQQKGIAAAKVEAKQAGGGPGQAPSAISLSITTPQITVGELHLNNTLPSLAPLLDKLRARLREEDFDVVETAKAVHDSVADIYQNAGYLDVATTTPTYGAPHQSLTGYAVDLTAEVTAGEVYRVNDLRLLATAPLTPIDLTKVSGLKPGDPASPAALRLARGEMEQAFRNDGYLDAQSRVATQKDSAAHTVVYTVTFAPGAIYHFAALDTTQLPAAQQAAFARDFHVAAGAVANLELRQAVNRVVYDLHAQKTITIDIKPDPAHHTVTLVLRPVAAGR
jgi:outer membrane protein assembly factor BamA